MPRWIQAVTEKGFELKLTHFVVAFASMQLATHRYGISGGSLLALTYRMKRSLLYRKIVLC